MVGDRLSGKAVAVGATVGRRLVEAYPAFVQTQPAVLQRSYRTLSLATCEDIVQEAALAVARRAAAGELAPETNVTAYLRTTARNLAVDMLRERQRTNGGVVLLGGTEALDTVVPRQREVGDEDQRVLHELVIPAISSMPAGPRKRVVDLQSRGMSDTDIAATLGIPAARLHNLRNKAVTQLRHALAGHIRDGQRKKRQHGKQGNR
ncbi:RNA polymerase sigma factor [Streptomyces sp. NPDC057798]|uniref:RNA polymerase sigma factor n=1 Tax=Streptomyces sp. NPDC057798 TaxID=3346252 RepID=UPI00368D03B7